MSETRVPVEGELAPLFAGTATTGPISLADYQGRSHVILYFYPRADTPGCTRESCGFRDAKADLARLGAAVVGVSADDLDAQSAFATKYDLGFPLIADVGRAVIDAYGVWGERRRPDGTSTMGIRRMTFLIDRQGVIRKVYPNVTPDGHAEELARDIAALG